MSGSPRPERHADPRVGARLRSLRHRRGLTIQQVAAATGLTKGFISQLERDATSPSLSSLARLCDALDVRLGDIFVQRDPAVSLVRRHERPRAPWNPEHSLLSPPHERRLHAIEAVVPPGSGAGDELYTFPGESEFVYVVRGVLELRVEQETYVLEAGDTLTYSPRTPHTWRNPSASDDTVVLWVSSPNPFQQ